MAIKNLSDLYRVTKSRLEGQHGTITINFANRSHVYSGNDVIGNCLQEWLPNWFAFGRRHSTRRKYAGIS